MNWLFLAVVIFLFAMGVYGYVRGLIRMVYSVVALIVSIAAMLLIAPFLSSVLKSNEIVMDTIENPIRDTIGKNLDDGVDVDGILQDYYHLPEGISGQINEMISDDVEVAKESISESIARTIAEYICDLFSYIIIFIAVRIIILVVGNLLHIVEKLPVISTMNHLGGTILALVEAMGCVWILFIVIQLLNATRLGHILINMVWQNDFLRMLHQNNPLLFLMEKL